MNKPAGVYPGEFFSIKTRFIASGEYREPKQGEYYLSGAVIQAYRASSNLTSKYWIARQVRMVPCACCAGQGAIPELEV